MTWFEDLTPYTYGQGAERYEPFPGLPLVNVGWLDRGRPFPTGTAPEGLVERLAQLAERRVLQMRGMHICDFCVELLGGDAREALQLGLVAAGSAEFRVLGDGKVYALPQLAVHYVAEHGYLPPDEFCEVVLRGA